MDVIIELSKDRLFYAVPQHDYNIGFFGCGKTIEDAKADLYNSYCEAKEFSPQLPDDVKFEYSYDLSCFIKHFGKRYSFAFLNKLTGISEKMLMRYATGKSIPTEATVRKIAQRINVFKSELEEYNLATV